jgi:spermidine synthase
VVEIAKTRYPNIGLFLTAGDKYDLILLDVDSKDPTVGMSSPPKAFIQPEFLSKLAACLEATGILPTIQVFSSVTFVSL